jgi:uncharacterized protein (DUF2141 family)
MPRQYGRSSCNLTPISRLLGLALLPSLGFQMANAATLPCNAANPTQVRLEVSVSGMRTTKGQIVITIYPDAQKGFLKGAYKLAEQRLPVVLPVTRACFVMPAPGYYAVALFGDVNDNDHFDLTALGLPAEGYGFSNNPQLVFGPPKIGKVRFPGHIGENQIDVRMQYDP